MQTFEDVVRATRTALGKYCRKLTRADDQAEDLLQEVYLRALPKWSEFSTPQTRTAFEAVKSWLFRIAFRTWTDQRAHEQVILNHRAVALGETPTHAHPRTRVDVIEPPHEPLEERVCDDVLNALAEVDPVFREALIRHTLKEERVRDIAEDLGVPVNTVKSRLSRARAQLKENLTLAAGELG